VLPFLFVVTSSASHARLLAKIRIEVGWSSCVMWLPSFPALISGETI
jgi:hypothetical protein